MKTITLGQKIRQARKSKGLTQQEVVGDFITRNMLSKIENDVANPSIKTVEYLAKRLNKPVSYLLENLVSSNMETKSSAELAFEHSSYMMKNGELDNCISYLEEILSKSTFNNSDVYHGRILYNIGYCFRKKRNYEKVEEYINIGMSILDNSNDCYYLSKCYFELGFVKLFEEEYLPAEKFFAEAIRLFNKSYVNDVITEIQLNHNLGFALYKQGKYLQALKSVLYTLETSKANNYYHYSGDSHMLAANCYSKLDNLTEAIEHEEKAVFFFGLSEKQLYKAKSIKNLGHYYYRKQLYSKSKESFREALEYFEKENNIVKINSIKVELLKIMIKEKEYLKVIEYANEINKYSITSKELANLYNCLGKAYLEEDALDESKEILLKAKTLATEENDLQAMVEIYANLADIYSAKNDYQKAYDYSSKSSKIIKQIMEDKSEKVPS